MQQGGKRIFARDVDGNVRKLSWRPGSDSSPGLIAVGDLVLYVHQDPNSQATEVIVTPADGSQFWPDGMQNPLIVGSDWTNYAWQP